MDRKIKIGVIGAGRIGKLHTENIVSTIKHAEVKAIADVNAEHIRNWANGLGIQNVYHDYSEILSDCEIDAVMICSSTNTHSQITIEAANAGKHIFCEKPIDYDLERIHTALEAVRKAGIKFQVGFNRRFDHNFKTVRNMVREGKVGNIHIVKITSRDPEPPPIEYIKVSGGIFLDMTIHDFDMARYLSGSEVVEVFTSAAVLVDPAIGVAGDVDTALITLKFANGAMGIIDNSRKAVYGYDQRVEVFGSKGCAAVTNDTPNTAVLSTGEGVLSEKPKHFFLERYKDSFLEEIKEFIDAVIYDKETPVTGIDGLKPILIAMAAKKSYETGKPATVE